ncbi:MAG: CHAD domain-containing protein [Proteocatella sp.]
MDLIIVRHGKAENIDSSLNKIDFNRSLTDEGVQNIISLSNILKNLIISQNYKCIKIISSSSTRTSQTAKIIAKSLDIKDMQFEDNLYNGDYYSMLPTLISSNHDADCIILVGHNPNIFFLSYNLLGFEIEYKKGSAACFKLNESLSHGNLQYFISGEAVKNFNLSFNESNENIIDLKFKQKTFLGIDISDIKFEIDEILNDFYLECSKFSDNSQNPETIHQMRLYLRQIITLLDFVKIDLDEASFKKVNLKLRNINSELAIIRDLDQFISYLEKLEGYDYFKKASISQRKDHELDLLYRIKSDTFHNLDELISELIWINGNDKIKHVNDYIKDLLLEIKKNKKLLSLDNYKHLHSVRIMGKKIKNMFEIFPDAINNKTLLIEKDILKFVKCLGDINDYHNSSKILDILYKLSFKQEVDNPELIDAEYADLNSTLRKDLNKKFKKIKLPVD